MKTADQDQAINALRRDMKNTGTVYGLVTARNGGVSRHVRVFIVEDGRIRERTNTVARAIGAKLVNEQINIKGYGFSAIGDIVDRLNFHLWPDMDASILLKGEHL